MFVVNKISWALLVVAVVTLLIGLIYSSIRNSHDLSYRMIHNLTNSTPNQYRLIVKSSTWLDLIQQSCGVPPIHLSNSWYSFYCTNTTFIDLMLALESVYTQRLYDGTVIKIVYVSAFSFFIILAFVAGRLYGLWQHRAQSTQLL